MHEFSVASSLVEAATEAAERAAAVRVARIRCRIGQLCHIDTRLMTEAFDIASRGTPCEGAELEIEKVPAQATCPRCRVRFALRRWDWHCPTCGLEGQALVGGDELELRCIEVEVDDEDQGPGRAKHPAAQRAGGT